jgi:DNA-directed RNA polymerase subunit K/omega
VIRRPDGMGSFEFATLASLRAAQLMHGCTPRVIENHTTAITAQLEVAEGKVTSIVKALQHAGGQDDA